MTGRRLRVLAAALALVLAAGCGSDDGDRRGTAVEGEPGQGHAEGDAHEGENGGEGHSHPEPTLVDPKTGKQGKIREGERYSAVSPPPLSFRQPDHQTTAGDVPLSASVAPGCVEHGKEVTAVFRSQPNITVAAQIKYPNEQFSGLDNIRGQTGPDGSLTWKVLVKPTALYGEANLQAAAIDEVNRSRAGTSGTWLFVVAPPGRC